ncbi:hypothetical protein [Flavobacterium sp.]|uniref:hypothetical protein n=1 Tax=Flavobacterium sp. TaxID=239 RepID=UPI004048D1ED
MEENIYLNEILILISKNYFEKKIDKDDLNKIESHLSDLKKNNVSIKLNFKQIALANDFSYGNLMALIGEIPSSEYNDYRNFFLTSFKGGKLDKKFKYPITQFTEFIETKKDIKVHLIQVGKVFDLAFEIDSEYYVSSGNTLKKIGIKELDKYKTEFNNDLGFDLDCNLKKLSSLQFEYNTRVILIDYETNFKTITIDNIDSLILEPGIINKNEKYKNRFTMMMYFITKSGNVLSRTTAGDALYFDTFCLNPPDNC